MSLPSTSWDVLGDLGPYPDEKSALIDIEGYRQDGAGLLIAVIDKQVERRGGDGFAGVYGLEGYDTYYMVSHSSWPPFNPCTYPPAHG
jgi:hypothetical protein